MVSIDFGLRGNIEEKEEPEKKPDLCLELARIGPSDKDAAAERIASGPFHGDDCKTNPVEKANGGEGSYLDRGMEMELCIELACIRPVGEDIDADDAKHAEKAKMGGKGSRMDCLCIELTCIRSVGEDAGKDDAKHAEKAKMRGKGSYMDCLAQEVCVRTPEIDADVDKIGPRPSHDRKYSTNSVKKAYGGREGYCPECGVKIACPMTNLSRPYNLLNKYTTESLIWIAVRGNGLTSLSLYRRMPLSNWQLLDRQRRMRKKIVLLGLLLMKDPSMIVAWKWCPYED